MKRLIFLLLIGWISMACSRDHALTQSVFIPDDTYPDLPAYSQWGYNTFGAHYERGAITHTEVEFPMFVHADTSHLRFKFFGKSNWGDFDNFRFTFSFPDTTIRNVYELTKYHDTVIDLSQNNVILTFESWHFDSVQEIKIDTGQFHFKNAKLVYVDEELTQVNVSGTFDLSFNFNQRPVAFTHGRFDIGLDPFRFVSEW
jgi:hypothetical protein